VGGFALMQGELAALHAAVLETGNRENRGQSTVFVA
jgi:hypothetical protein